MSAPFPFPEINASLNALSALLITGGLFFIHRGRVSAHRACMLAAAAASLLFLVSYLIYHARVGHVPFQGQGAVRRFYFLLLGSHTLLALAIVPMVIRTLYLGLTQKVDRHKRLARWTAPLWLYVSVTGVIVYWMLYRSPWSV